MDRTTCEEAVTGTGRWPRIGGTWHSELGSELTLVEEGDGVLHGTYRSAVGRTRMPQPLMGTCVERADGSAMVGFVVAWPATVSLATWTGRYQPVAEDIVATWLLESGSTDATIWRATNLGCDVFRRPKRQAGNRTP